MCVTTSLALSESGCWSPADIIGIIIFLAVMIPFLPLQWYYHFQFYKHRDNSYIKPRRPILVYLFFNIASTVFLIDRTLLALSHSVSQYTAVNIRTIFLWIHPLGFYSSCWILILRLNIFFSLLFVRVLY